MDKDQQTSGSQCYIPSSKPVRIQFSIVIWLPVHLIDLYRVSSSGCVVFNVAMIRKSRIKEGVEYMPS
jgi:hypothetical protein